MSSSIPHVSTLLTHVYKASSSPESSSTTNLLTTLNLQPHIEGGYYSEIDRDPLLIPNPFLGKSEGQGGDWDDDKKTTDKPFSGDDSVRNASTSIYYCLTARRPQGHFHRNRGRTVHTLISGRGRYVLIHADEAGQPKRVESFAVGLNITAGEKAVWIVEGGKYKASYLLPEGDDANDDARLLISETVVPGFEFSDHDFLTEENFRKLITKEQAKELEWLVRKE